MFRLLEKIYFQIYYRLKLLIANPFKLFVGSSSYRIGRRPFIDDEGGGSLSGGTFNTNIKESLVVTFNTNIEESLLDTTISSDQKRDLSSEASRTAIRLIVFFIEWWDMFCIYGDLYNFLITLFIY